MGPTASEQPEGRCESAERTNDRVLVKKTEQNTSASQRQKEGNEGKLMAKL